MELRLPEDAVILLTGSLAIAALVARLCPAARKYLPTRIGWAAAAIGAMILSGVSWFVTEERMGGTLLKLRHGWPKFYSLECLSPECTSRWHFDIFFFLGNSFFHGAALVLVWTLIAAMLAFFNRKSSTIVQ